MFQKVDVTNAASVEAAVEEVVDRWGAIHVLVNNAGILRDGQLVKYKDGALAGMMSDEQFDSVIGVNLRGVFTCTRAVAPRMIQGGGGVILNASSVVGLYGNFGQTNYVAARPGVIGMTRVWARELGKYQIRVNAVAPGFIATDMVKPMPEKVLQGMRRAIRRWAAWDSRRISPTRTSGWRRTPLRSSAARCSAWMAGQ